MKEDYKVRNEDRTNAALSLARFNSVEAFEAFCRTGDLSHCVPRAIPKPGSQNEFILNPQFDLAPFEMSWGPPHTLKRREKRIENL